MNRLLFAGPLCALLALAFEAGTLQRAYACSAGPDWDPVVEADAIVEGRVTGYELQNDEFTSDPYVPIKINMQLTRVFKGNVQTGSFSLYDAASYVSFPGQVGNWGGSGGACGAFSEDPTGKYVILGLRQRADGTFGSNLLLWFYYADDRGGEGYDRALERLSGLPAAGAGPPVVASVGALWMVTLLAVGGVFLLFAGWRLGSSNR